MGGFLKKLFGRGEDPSLSTSTATPERPAVGARRLRMHEYVALLAAGTHMVELDDPLRAQALSAAKSLWSETGFDAWAQHDRRLAHAQETADGQTVLAHVTGDWKDCFAIVGLDRASGNVAFLFVFDIGAEYRAIEMDCPDLPTSEPLTPEILARAVASLRRDDESFLILDAGGGTYMQAARTDDGFTVEFQLATLKNHYEAPTPVDADQAIELLTAYAFGRKEWASRVDWRYLPL